MGSFTISEQSGGWTTGSREDTPTDREDTPVGGAESLLGIRRPAGTLGEGCGWEFVESEEVA